MAVTTTGTFTQSGYRSGRVGIQKWIRIEADQRTTALNLVNTKSTTQDFIVEKQISDFGYPQETSEGAASYLDNKVNLYTGTVTPVEYTLMFALTNRALFTDQYNIFDSYKEDIRDAFVDLRSLSICNLFNNGFSASYTGFDAVALFSTAHPYQSYPTWSNRGNSSGVDMNLSYDNVGIARTQMRTVKTARQRPMRMRSGVILLVPPALEYKGLAIEKSMTRPDTANRETNVVTAGGLRVQVEEDLSSTTAWFLLDQDTKKTGLTHLTQMPIKMYEGEWDPKTRSKYISFTESFADYWSKAHRVWGTTGA
jgi:hypothetical protein